MAEPMIIFAPVCSKCGKIIYGEVGGAKYPICKDISSPLFDSPSRNDHVVPEICPHCGVVFKEFLIANYIKIANGTVDMSKYLEVTDET